MNAKETKVVLIAGSLKQEFTFVEAETLLRMPNNGGWHLPPNSNFEFVDDAIRYKQADSGVKRPKKARNA